MNVIDEHRFMRSQSTLYSLEGDEVDWYTGHTNAGNQLLVVLQFPDVYVLTFTAEGVLHEVTEVPGFPSESSGYFSSIDDERLLRWFEQVGYNPGLIKVKKFALTDRHILIRDFPQFYQNMLEHSDIHAQDEIDFARQELARWSSEGLFELTLNEFTDLWVDETGKIQAA